MKIVFSPHPVLAGHEIAKVSGFSIVHGPFIRGYEVMDCKGEVSSGYTLEEVCKLIEDFVDED